jgi:hypothetical protein
MGVSLVAVDRDFDPDQKPKQRTLNQNRALHKYFENISETLNDHGLDIKKTLASNAEVPWSAALVKELLWRPLMRAQVRKNSTTQLTTSEIDLVLDTITKYLGQNHGLTVNFPSIETLIHENQAKDQHGQRG